MRINDNGDFHLSDSLGADEILRANNAALDFKGYAPTYKQLESYDHLIDKADLRTVKYGQGGLKESLDVIRNYIRTYSPQVRRLAHHISGAVPKNQNYYYQLGFNLWHFSKSNIKYAYDEPGKEQLRTPARAWNDRLYPGIDCDDFSIFIACLLQELNVPWKLKIVAFNGKQSFSHIYVVIPRDGRNFSNGYIVLDGVMNAYNEDPKGVTKSFMEGLNGFGFPIKPFISFALGSAENDSVLNDLRSRLTALEQKNDSRKISIAEAKDLRKLRAILAMVNVGEGDSATVLLKMMPHIRDIAPNGKIIWEEDAVDAIANFRITEDDLSNEEYKRAQPALAALQECAKSLGALPDDEADILMDIIHPDEDESLSEALGGITEGLSGMYDDDVEEYLSGLLGELSIDEISWLAGLYGKRKEKRQAKKAAKKQAKDEGKKGKAARQAGRAAAKDVKAQYAKAGSNKQQRLTTKAKILKAKASGDKAALEAAKKERRERIKENMKKIGTVLKKLDPLLGIARGSYLGLLRVNFLGHATKLKYLQEKKPEGWKAFLKKWKKLGGAEKRVKVAIDKGHKKKPLFKKGDKSIANMKQELDQDDNIKGLGLAPAAPAVAAATAIISAIGGLLSKFMKKGEAPVPGENTPEAIALQNEFPPIHDVPPGAAVSVDTDGDGDIDDDDVPVTDVNEDGTIDQSDVEIARQASKKTDDEVVDDTEAGFPWKMALGIGVPVMFVLGAFAWSGKKKNKS